MSKLEKRLSSAAVVLYDETGRVLVVKALYKHYWSFPGGVVDAGETPATAAAREVVEEVGIPLTADKLTFCMVVDRLSTMAETYQFIFERQVEPAVFESIVLDRSETADFSLVTREEILSGNKHYSQTVVKWAEGFRGYLEQEFGPDMQGTS